jgi:hypothetical protein
VRKRKRRSRLLATFLGISHIAGSIMLFFTGNHYLEIREDVLKSAACGVFECPNPEPRTASI